MKKFIVLALTLALALAAGASGALADTIIPNSTYVQSYKGHNVYSEPVSHSTPAPNPPGATWYDRIGEENIYETYGAVFSGSILTIYTNWNPDHVGDNTAITADLFLKTGGSTDYNYAVQLNDVLTKTGGLGTFSADILAAGSNPTTSEDLFHDKTNLVYGGRYYSAAGTALLVPVLATGADTNSDANVIWASAAGNSYFPNAAYRIAINLSNVPDIAGTPFCFLWATGTCANDTAKGDPVVPIPGALVLLGAGLVRLAGYARRKRVMPDF
ncbi:MAG: VPLPA-CTERM sorting domain-containing protein [Thermodesulfobacteriota bacterium]